MYYDSHKDIMCLAKDIADGLGYDYNSEAWRTKAEYVTAAEKLLRWYDIYKKEKPIDKA